MNWSVLIAWVYLLACTINKEIVIMILRILLGENF